MPMEAAKHLLPSPPCPPITRLTNSSSSSSPSSSVLILQEQHRPAITSARYVPASVLIQEQRDESKPLLNLVKKDKTSQEAVDRRRMGTASSAYKENDNLGSDQYMNDFQLQMFPGLWYSLISAEIKERCSQLMNVPSVPGKTDKNIEPHDVIALAKKALLASREAVSLSETSSDSLRQRLVNVSVEERTVRSTRLLQRRSKRRRMPRLKVEVEETKLSERTDAHKRSSETVNQNDPLRLFLSCGETKLLTWKEEFELIGKIQGLMKLEEVKNRLHDQFARKPTLLEWAEATGLSCRALQSELRSGNSCREKLIYANFRMVVHVAKQYQGRGLSLPDLFQEGSMGLMKSVEKFKPQAGCRFGTYAYWWIRQAIRKAIFQHSRTIRLPVMPCENVYGLLSKVREAKKLCVQQGLHPPKKEEIAGCAAITVEKLDKLLFTARTPLSMQQPVWTDQDTTFQEITADNSMEVPDMSIAKQLMREHVRSLLNVLSPKERKILQMRFGIKDGKLKSLSEIGGVFGLSKERVRQLESRALSKLKQHLGSHGLGAYAGLLI